MPIPSSRLRLASLGIALTAAAVLSACQAPPTREQSGMVVGGVLGGVLGSQVGGGSGRTAATIIGAIAGAAIGGSVGRSMDETDRMKMASTLETQRTGAPSRWTNPDTGHAYVVTPTRTYGSDTRPCREYTMDAVIGGKREQVIGTACRDPDGNWRVTR